MQELNDQNGVEGGNGLQQSFRYRNFHRLRDRGLRNIVLQILCNILFVIVLVILNLYTNSIEVKSEFSVNERNWICQTLTEVSLLYAAIVIFKVFTIGVAPTEMEYRVKITVLVVFTLIINIRIIQLYFDGLDINKDAITTLNNDA